MNSCIILGYWSLQVVEAATFLEELRRKRAPGVSRTTIILSLDQQCSERTVATVPIHLALSLVMTHTSVCLVPPKPQLAQARKTTCAAIFLWTMNIRLPSLSASPAHQPTAVQMAISMVMGTSRTTVKQVGQWTLCYLKICVTRLRCDKTDK